jgi:hypothetical protein
LGEYGSGSDEKIVLSGSFDKNCSSKMEERVVVEF